MEFPEKFIGIWSKFVTELSLLFQIAISANFVSFWTDSDFSPHRRDFKVNFNCSHILANNLQFHSLISSHTQNRTFHNQHRRRRHSARVMYDPNVRNVINCILGCFDFLQCLNCSTAQIKYCLMFKSCLISD